MEGYLINPEHGTTCPALNNENYEYHLSGDAAKFCTCSINGEACVGRAIIDPDEQTSQFFSRGKCAINIHSIKKCPLYGVSRETFRSVLTDRANFEYKEKINRIK